MYEAVTLAVFGRKGFMSELRHTKAHKSPALVDISGLFHCSIIIIITLFVNNKQVYEQVCKL